MPDFAFPWLRHGPFEPDYLDKCEEIFLWFERPVSHAERERIEADCPAPLADFYAWGDTWTYFGSPGDAYDSLIRLGFSGLAEDAGVDEIRALYEDDEALSRALEAFATALEAWVRKAHSIVPIAFFFGPGGTQPDAWGTWSEAKVRDLWTRVSAVPAQAAEEDDDHPARYLGYIRGIAAGLVAEHGDPKEVAAELYALDGIHGPIHRLSYEEGKLHTNGSLLSRALGKGKARAKKLATWPPYVQLAYLASYEALDEEDLTRFADPIATLRALADALPADRQAAGAHLLAFIADSWVHNTPAFSKPRKKHAKLAAEILELACSRPDATAEMFVNASGYADLAEQPAWMLTLARAGLARFPEEPLIWSNAISAAGQVGDEPLARQLADELLAAPIKVEGDSLGLEVIAIQLNNLGRPAEVLARVDPEQVEMTTTLWECWTWASVLTGTAPQARQAIDTFAARHTEKKVSADTAENLALLHLKLAEDAAGVKRLKEALKGGKKAKEVRKSKEWAPYLALPGVHELLG